MPALQRYQMRHYQNAPINKVFWKIVLERSRAKKIGWLLPHTCTSPENNRGNEKQRTRKYLERNPAKFFEN